MVTVRSALQVFFEVWVRVLTVTAAVTMIGHAVRAWLVFRQLVEELPVLLRSSDFGLLVVVICAEAGITTYFTAARIGDPANLYATLHFAAYLVGIVAFRRVRAAFEQARRRLWP